MNTPFFSVLVPVYNVSRYLDICVNSLVSQTYKDFEIILLDDGSTDDSGKKCDEWQAKDDRIRVIHRENRGLFTTRLDEIEAAKGEYLVFVDSDDYIADNTLEFLYERIVKGKYDVITYGRSIVDENEKVRRIELSVYEDESVFEQADRNNLLIRMLKNNDLTSIWSKCVKRTLMLDIMTQLREYEGVNSGEDRIFTASIICNYNSFMYTDAPLYFYRCNGQGMSNTAQIKHFPDSLVCRKALKHFIENCKCNQKEQVINRFWDREWYGTLYLLKEYLRFDIDKKVYKNIYSQVMESIRTYGNCKIKYRMTFFLFNPVFYSLIKFLVKKVWPVKN